ncbi:polymer-forming cytoskeletal protein [Patescibacteria group bacterium]|nr:polymer-forming cytoskeletal protein [Patescibacteria group bacterium]MBU1705246.1 polymer-forming cytoskeletal protein [Patescibacteria group bacterium]
MSASQNETIIAEGVKMDGDFVSQGHVVIDGDVTGSVQTSQSLRVGETAKIHADISAGSAVIAGEVEGNVRVVDRLDITETAMIHGDVETQVLSVAAGAQLNGRVTMNQSNQSNAEASEAD